MTPRPLLPAWLLAISTALLLPAALHGQSSERISISAEPGSPVVAIAVWIETPGAPRDSSEAGLGALAARAVHAPVLERLDAQGAHLEVEARHGGALFTLLAAPDHWEIAFGELALALFRDPPDAAVVALERDRLLRELRAVEPNPALQAEIWTDRLVYGGEHPWRNPPLGYSSTVGALTADEVDRFLRRHFVPENALFAIVGPVDGDRVARVIDPYLSRQDRPSAAAIPPVEPGVHQIDYPTITSWVTLVYPIESGSDLDSFEQLAGSVTDALAFGPRSRSIYNARAWVVHRPGRPELRIEVVVPPRETDLWADHVEALMAGYSGGALTGSEIDRILRRQRGLRALASVHPEDRARRILERQIVGGEGDALDAGRVDAARLRSAARTLSAPVIVKLGPFESSLDD